MNGYLQRIVAAGIRQVGESRGGRASAAEWQPELHETEAPLTPPMQDTPPRVRETAPTVVPFRDVPPSAASAQQQPTPIARPGVEPTVEPRESSPMPIHEPVAAREPQVAPSAAIHLAERPLSATYIQKVEQFTVSNRIVDTGAAGIMAPRPAQVQPAAAGSLAKASVTHDGPFERLIPKPDRAAADPSNRPPPRLRQPPAAPQTVPPRPATRPAVASANPPTRAPIVARPAKATSGLVIHNLQVRAASPPPAPAPPPPIETPQTRQRAGAWSSPARLHLGRV